LYYSPERELEIREGQAKPSGKEGKASFLAPSLIETDLFERETANEKSQSRFLFLKIATNPTNAPFFKVRTKKR